MLPRVRRLITFTSLYLALSIGAADVSFAEGFDAVKFASAYYVESRAFSTASISVSSDRLPGGVSLWGFTDFHGDHDSHDLALTRSFSEYRLSHAGVGKLFNTRGLSVQAELNSMTGNGNDLARVGLTYKHNLPLPWGKDTGSQGWLQWRAFPYETDNDGGQASLIFFLPITPRVHVKGFADYNINEGADNRWVVEPELNVQITQRLWALLEFRYNQFEDANPATRGSGAAIGIRYQFNR